MQLPCDRRINAAGRYVSPGFIDIHTHGGGGFDFLDGTSEAFLKAAQLYLRYRATAIIPTVISGDPREISKMSRAHARECFFAGRLHKDLKCKIDQRS